MPNFTGFPPDYLVSSSSSEVPLLVNDVRRLTEAARDAATKLYKGRPRYWIFNFNLENMPHVMVQIMLFGDITKPESNSPEDLERLIRQYIKNKIDRELRKKHKGDDPKKDYYTVEGRLDYLGAALEDLRLMEDRIHEVKAGLVGQRFPLKYSG
ncbi:hypothetical protein ONS95_000019 [Cadophora gregata]|uniref:uncharacterized protein n=1 Tax=Cadophora gregata TaxID=51156 RepID=UPI0026DC00D6|nr:uncharacterized protein ONS95_000019 [Cadophora gregata]KAK0115721.1 hypothetical protein ONS96_014160 [Cadophora gregata f. sp. sojae]KAK0128033.1 hypothetical protein ONS95_000019 [Cadophora gregata]